AESRGPGWARSLGLTCSVLTRLPALPFSPLVVGPVGDVETGAGVGGGGKISGFFAFDKMKHGRPLAEDWADLLKPWLAAVFGHHGKPVSCRQDSLAELLLPRGLPFSLEPLDEQEERFKAASWRGRRNRGVGRSEL